MRYSGETQITEPLVLLQAADIVGATVRETLEGALRAADVCGCRTCRARAAQTFLWAVGMTATADEELDQ